MCKILYFKAFKQIKGYTHTVNGVEKKAADIRDGKRDTRLKSSFILKCHSNLLHDSCALRATGVTTVVSTTLESFRIPSTDLMDEISVCSSPSFKKHMDRQGNRSPGMCPGCHVHVCHGHPRSPVTLFPMLSMSFYLVLNFWHVATYTHATPPLPSEQIHSEDTEASGHEPQPRDGTQTCKLVLKTMLWECGGLRIRLVQRG